MVCCVNGIGLDSCFFIIMLFCFLFCRDFIGFSLIIAMLMTYTIFLIPAREHIEKIVMRYGSIGIAVSVLRYIYIAYGVV